MLLVSIVSKYSRMIFFSLKEYLLTKKEILKLYIKSLKCGIIIIIYIIVIYIIYKIIVSREVIIKFKKYKYINNN